MKNKTKKRSASTEILKNNNDIKELLEARTESLSFPQIKIKKSDKLTEKPQKKYKYLQKIGQGGMKNIIRVKDRDTARDIAMAILGDNPDLDETVPSRFIHEARITANLEHPNIVPIHDIGVDKKGKPYFTMKLIEGETLAHILTKIGKGNEEYQEKYNLRHLLRIFIKICNAIDFAHSKGIIHLDLKPENIQIGNYGEVLVLDWGLARIISEVSSSESLSPATDKKIEEISRNSDHDRTLDGEIKGTPGFMAPEQAAGNNSDRGTATDIYSLGAILYTILTLRKPIKGKKIEEVLDDTIAGNIIPIQDRNPAREVPKPIAAVVMKAMALDPKERYLNVTELITDVDSFLGGYVTKAEDAGFIRHIELLIKRNKISAAFICLFLVAVIISFGMLIIYKTKQTSNWGKALDITPRTQNEFDKNWEMISGNWKFEDGKIYAKKGDEDSFILFYDRLVYGNIAIEFDAEIPDRQDLEASGDLSLIIAGSKDNPKNIGYYLQLGGIGNTSAIIQRRKGFMTSVEFSLESGRKYRIRAEKEGANLTLYCDGKKILASRDIFYLEGGYIGLYTFGKGKVFSNIHLYRKDVPELVPPTIEGDAFYRESRALGDEEKEEKIKYLNLAKKAYTKVYESHPDSVLGAEALLKRAYISCELEGDRNIISAIHDILILKEINPTLDLMLLQGRIYFSGNDFAKAYSIYSQAIRKYPDSAILVTSILSGNLTPEKSKEICPELKQKFWRLCAENNSSPAFRCNSRDLASLDFLNALDFRTIDCSDNNITSLEPLKNMQIKILDCANNKIRSLDPIKNLNLESLECHNNKSLEDIEAISVMPLKKLSLSGCDSLKDISPIKNCRKLEKLTIPGQLCDYELLKSLPNLKYLNTEWDSWKMTKEEFFNTKDK